MRHEPAHPPMPESPLQRYRREAPPVELLPQAESTTNPFLRDLRLRSRPCVDSAEIYGYMGSCSRMI